MGNKEEKSLLTKTPAWALSLIVTVVSNLLYIGLDGIGSLKLFSNGSYEIILFSIYPILVALACFIICKTHPKSVWYTPLICNATYIFPIFLDPNFWTMELWPFHASLVFSVIGAIVGSIIGRRLLIKQND